MKHALYVLVMALLWVVAPVTAAQQTHELLRKGNSELLAGNPETALDAYNALAESGVSDANLEYNRALAHAEAGRLGAAILHLERARSLNPGDDQIAATLERTRDALGQRLAEAQGEATVRTRPPLMEALTAPFTAGAFAWLLWLAVVVASLGWLVLMHARAESRRLAAGIAVALGLGLSALGAGGLAVKSGWLREGERALVIAPELAVREAPDERAPRVGTLEEGGRTALLERQGDYVRVRTSATQGWVRAEGVGTY